MCSPNYSATRFFFLDPWSVKNDCLSSNVRLDISVIYWSCNTVYSLFGLLSVKMCIKECIKNFRFVKKWGRMSLLGAAWKSMGSFQLLTGHDPQLMI